MTIPPAVTRRQFFKGMGAAGVAAASAPAAAAAPTTSFAGEPVPAMHDGTPEQIHLTWGEDPATSVVVSWASLAQAIDPHVMLHSDGRSALIHGVQRTYTDGLSGQTVFTYHAKINGLRPDTAYRYAVSSNNDRNRHQPFEAKFQTAPRGRQPIRWTSYGDLATPNTAWKLSFLQSRFAVQAVEKFKPLFHLMNGDLCYANLNPEVQPSVWADFGNNVQASAAQRPWMPCPGNHEIEFCNGPTGHLSYLTRYCLPNNGTPFEGLWYRFQAGSALFISLTADDVIYQDSGAFVTGPDPFQPVQSTGNAAIEPGTSFYIRGFSGGEQTRWLEHTLAAASEDPSIDWIIVQMHQDAMSSSRNGNGSDKGIREAWLPLFDRYGVDLVLCGHDHDYERTWPVRGCNHNVGRDAITGASVDTCQPNPITTTTPPDGKFDTTHGTIHFILGGGGTSAPLDAYGVDASDEPLRAKITTQRNAARRTASGTFTKPPADATEDAIWSARRDTDTGYGLGVFDLDPGQPHGKTSITVRYFHALGADKVPTAEYQLFETIIIEKDRKDRLS